MNTQTPAERELAELIVDSLNLPNRQAADIAPEAVVVDQGVITSRQPSDLEAGCGDIRCGQFDRLPSRSPPVFSY